MKISAVLMVKNESDNLKRYLRPDLWNETVVVDTGSTDDTETVAQQLGARVEHFAWCDDYSAARNYGIEKAKNDWVLILDADEYIEPKDMPLVRKCAKMGKDYFWVTIWTMTTPLESSNPGVSLGTVVRLFRKSSGIRFVNIIHERVDATLEGKVGDVAPFGIYHFGHLQGKVPPANEDYYRLNMRQLELTPGSHRHYFYVASYWMHHKNWSKVREYLLLALQHDIKGEMRSRYINDLAELEAVDPGRGWVPIDPLYIKELNRAS